MSNFKAELDLPYSLTSVERACHEAVTELGWLVLDQRDNVLVCKEHIAFTCCSTHYPAHVEIVWMQDGGNTRITLNGSIFYGGPIQNKHLKEQVENLKNRIEINLRNTESSSPKSTLADELEKLAFLREKEIISEEEFAKAKEKLLDSSVKK